MKDSSSHHGTVIVFKKLLSTGIQYYLYHILKHNTFNVLFIISI
jgi:hypothetical protein